ncbi:MAG: hypothetical protein ABL993_11750 [Vicinamibacterales bacterium]
MRRRLLAFTLVVVVLTVPLAAAVCEAACAARAMATSSDQASGSHHACHEVLPVSGSLASGIPHACGHDDALARMWEPTFKTLIAPAVVPVAASVAPAVAVAPAVFSTVQHSPPGSFRLSSPLRV